MVQLLHGDTREVLASIADESVQCCVTSPPYWGLRDYGIDGQIGLETTPEAYVERLVNVFREVRRVLRADGTLWLNLGDSYASDPKKGGSGPGGKNGYGENYARSKRIARGTGRWGYDNVSAPSLKPKDLCGIPWMVAFALRADGWYLRQDIIWHKPNPMPESVRDRCTKSHEYLFLLSKSERYFYDYSAMLEPASDASVARRRRDDYRDKEGWSDAYMGNPPRGLAGNGRGGRNAFRGQGSNRDAESGHANRNGRDMRNVGAGMTRNRRSVWSIATKPYREAHFAVFPEALVEPCIRAGSHEGDAVLDPFCGSGTVGVVCQRFNRDFIGIDLNPAYIALAEKRNGLMDQGGRDERR